MYVLVMRFWPTLNLQKLFSLWRFDFFASRLIIQGDTGFETPEGFFLRLLAFSCVMPIKCATFGQEKNNPESRKSVDNPVGNCSGSVNHSLLYTEN